MDTGSSTPTTPDPDSVSTVGEIAGAEQSPASRPVRGRVRGLAWLISWTWRSIHGRLLVLGVGLCLSVLALSGLQVERLYREQIGRLLDEDLSATLEALTVAIDSSEAGAVVITPSALPNDPRFRRVLSGWYYGVLELDPNGRVTDIWPSRSLWDSDPPMNRKALLQAMNEVGAMIYFDDIDGQGKPIRVAYRTIVLPDKPELVALFVAMDKDSVIASVARLKRFLGFGLAGLTVVLIVGLWIQLRIGLAPLKDIRKGLDRIREGEAERLEGNFVREIEPLVDNLNRLIEHNGEVVERARTHVGNLAHALKNPIAVIMNEPSNSPGFADLVRRNVQDMSDNVQHYLKRAQAAARAEVIGARTEIEPAIEEIAYIIERIHRDKDLAVEIYVDEGAVFRGERQDLDDLVGNLLENAGKWCRSRVAVTARVQDGGLDIVVDDDGPGLAPENRGAAMERGRRLDETAPGTGLGLSIVKETAELYGGTLSLDTSPMGGLRARLQLPAAPL